MTAFSNVFKNLAQSARSLQGNARVCVLYEPIWAIPQTIALAFQSLYFIALGCTAEQVGILTGAGMLSQFVCALFSGYITDRMGRRRTMAIFDTIGWAGALALFAVSRSFWGLLAASLLNGAFRISTTAWSCVFVEDTPPQDRGNAFTWLQTAGIAAGFFAPLGGMLVTALGIEPAERILLWCAVLGMVLMTILRTWHLKETNISRQMRQISREQSAGELLQGYVRSLRRLRADSMLLGALTIRALLFSMANLRTTYLPMTLTQGLGLPDAVVATLQTVMSIVMMAMLLFGLPAMQRRDVRGPLMAAFLAALVAHGVLLVLPKGLLWPVLADGVVLAVAVVTTEPLMAAMFANSMQENERALMTATMALLSLIVSAVFQYAGGVAARLEPRSPMILIAALSAVCALVLLGMMRKGNAVAPRAQAPDELS